MSEYDESSTGLAVSHRKTTLAKLRGGLRDAISRFSGEKTTALELREASIDELVKQVVHKILPIVTTKGLEVRTTNGGFQVVCYIPEESSLQDIVEVRYFAPKHDQEHSISSLLLDNRENSNHPSRMLDYTLVIEKTISYNLWESTKDDPEWAASQYATYEEVPTRQSIRTQFNEGYDRPMSEQQQRLLLQKIIKSKYDVNESIETAARLQQEFKEDPLKQTALNSSSFATVTPEALRDRNTQ